MIELELLRFHRKTKYKTLFIWYKNNSYICQKRCAICGERSPEWSAYERISYEALSWMYKHKIEHCDEMEKIKREGTDNTTPF